MTRSTAEGAWIDLGPEADGAAEAILGWPDDFIGPLRGRLLAIRAGTGLSADDRDELVAHGLLAPSGRPTALGEDLVDLIVHESWQQGSERRTFREMGIDGGIGSVLEVGCSTGWALRSLGPASAGGRRLGVDVDARALALAYRFSRLEHQDCGFARCSALALPVDDGSIDFIICRNTLTYVNQRAALREMGRVLRPGGRIFLRFENIWYDLWQVAHRRGIRPLGWRLKDLGMGLIHAAVGWQPREGSRLRWGRAFVALPRLRTFLRDCGCEITQIDESLRCPRFWGFSTQTSILVRKTS